MHNKKMPQKILLLYHLYATHLVFSILNHSLSCNIHHYTFNRLITRTVSRRFRSVLDTYFLYTERDRAILLRVKQLKYKQRFRSLRKLQEQQLHLKSVIMFKRCTNFIIIVCKDVNSKPNDYKIDRTSTATQHVFFPLSLLIFTYLTKNISDSLRIS